MIPVSEALLILHIRNGCFHLMMYLLLKLLFKNGEYERSHWDHLFDESELEFCLFIDLSTL